MQWGPVRELLKTDDHGTAKLKWKRQELADFGAAVAAFEEQLRLAGYKITEDDRPLQGLATCGD